MKKYEATIIGIKKATNEGKKDCIFFTYEDNRIDGFGCGMTYELGASDKYNNGDVITVIESNFRYLII